MLTPVDPPRSSIRDVLRLSPEPIDTWEHVVAAMPQLVWIAGGDAPGST
ncbi:MAG TPA: hypothetical protein VK866_05155 [Acidimicrobiales bacterium]|nr:hypothetical protein [Acidimicrobiales bacterium]